MEEKKEVYVKIAGLEEEGVFIYSITDEDPLFASGDRSITLCRIPLEECVKRMTEQIAELIGKEDIKFCIGYRPGSCYLKELERWREFAETEEYKKPKKEREREFTESIIRRKQQLRYFFASEGLGEQEKLIDLIKEYFPKSEIDVIKYRL